MRPSEHLLVPGYELLELRRLNGHLVYLARQTGSGLLVELNFVNSAGTLAEIVTAHLREEAAALATLDHPNILRMVEIGNGSGHGFFTALEYAAGGPLAHRISTRPPAWTEAAAIARDICSALHYARARGVVQVDLTPWTVLLSADDVAKVAKLRRIDPKRSNASLAKALTPSYCAPEEIADLDVVDPAPGTDVYRVGAVLYFLLTGRQPFSVSDRRDVVRQIMEQTPTRVGQLNSAVPSGLDAICMKCLAKQQTKRYADAGELADVLTAFVESTETTA